MRNMNSTQKEISRVLDAVAEGYATPAAISKRTGVPLREIGRRLRRLRRVHMIEQHSGRLVVAYVPHA